MLRCDDCGNTFETEDLDYYTECVGEFWGSPAYETFYVCPYCGSDCYEEYEDDGMTEEERKRHKHNLLKGMYIIQEMDKK